MKSITNIPKVRGQTMVVTVNRKSYIEKNPDWETVAGYIEKLA